MGLAINGDSNWWIVSAIDLLTSKNWKLNSWYFQGKSLTTIDGRNPAPVDK